MISCPSLSTCVQLPLVALVVLVVLVCSRSDLCAAEPWNEPAFRHYWYDQGAEITRYELRQMRYGTERHGEAVLIFVTEPWSLADQVKSDDPTANDARPALKLNASRSFLTGIYPYSVLRSTFQGLDVATFPRAFKSTLSVQEWCGHVFEQFVQREEGWEYQLHSYFQSEGDQDRTLAGVLLEDALWLRLRIDPQRLPSGTISLIPAALDRRFAHRAVAPVQAEASLQPLGEGLQRYRIAYQTIDRRLDIDFQTAFPHAIEAWHEHSASGTTSATRTHQIHDAYWRHNRPGDEQRRRALGLGLD